jgi:hypothetical protein
VTPSVWFELFSFCYAHLVISYEDDIVPFFFLGLLIVLDTNIFFVERVELITSRLKLHIGELAFKQICFWWRRLLILNQYGARINKNVLEDTSDGRHWVSRVIYYMLLTNNMVSWSCGRAHVPNNCLNTCTADKVENFFFKEFHFTYKMWHFFFLNTMWHTYCWCTAVFYVKNITKESLENIECWNLLKH